LAQKNCNLEKLKTLIMKNSVLLIAMVFAFLTASVSAQETIHETIWFDSNWNITTKEKAIYYRPSPKSQKNGYLIVDYYMNGNKQMEGFSSINTPNQEKFDGVVKYYFEDGVLYQEISYQTGKINGYRKIYFKSGKLKEERDYRGDKRVGKHSEYYESGELSIVGKYLNNLKEGSWKVFYKNGKIKEKGKYEKGEKIGVWKTFFKNVYKK